MPGWGNNRYSYNTSMARVKGDATPIDSHRQMAAEFTKDRLSFAKDAWEHRHGNYLLQVGG